jgi:hypothetical protein
VNEFLSDLPTAKRLLHPLRLATLLHIRRSGGAASFAETRKAIGGPCTQSLSVHCQRLEEAGYLKRRRHFIGQVAATELAITDKAIEALDILGKTLETA